MLLIDLVMPETDGVAATRIIRERSPKTRVLVLSSLEEEAAPVASVRAGAIGFLRKTAPIGAVVCAIRAAARRGGPVLSYRGGATGAGHASARERTT